MAIEKPLRAGKQRIELGDFGGERGVVILIVKSALGRRRVIRLLLPPFLFQRVAVSTPSPTGLKAQAGSAVSIRRRVLRTEWAIVSSWLGARLSIWASCRTRSST